MPSLMLAEGVLYALILAPRRNHVTLTCSNQANRTGIGNFWLVLALAWAGLLVLSAGCSRVPSLQNGSPRTSELTGLQDLNGNGVDPLPPDSTNTTVFVFVSTDCPISNRYAPEIRRLHEKFAPLGIRFWLIYPSASELPGAIRKHLEEYQYPCSALRDPRHELVKRTQVRVTPEVAVFVPGPKLVYHGRIDDRYVDFGKERPAPTRRDLLAVLTSIASNQPVTNAPVPGVGCYISD
ncbi:MAG: redoxin domain-containing protein [Verrucomicrobia bacterium]|nr:redoxin domain-containing protein [Verrucomicrobiota bacterium]